MPRRTYESDGHRVEVADDLDDLVSDKREGWRRHRRYGKRLAKSLQFTAMDIDAN
jgi:hypothetical protein